MTKHSIHKFNEVGKFLIFSENNEIFKRTTLYKSDQKIDYVVVIG
jgi:hypothetical protein